MRPIVRALLTICGVALVCSCATTRAVRPPDIYVCQLSPPRDQRLLFEGLLDVECELTVSNVGDERLLMTALELHSTSGHAFRFHTKKLAMAEVIDAHGTITFSVSAAGLSPGGDFSDVNPVGIRGTAWFDSGHGSSVRVTFETLPIRGWRRPG